MARPLWGCVFVCLVMGSSEPHGSAILGSAPKGLLVLQGPPSASGIVTCQRGPLDTVADLCIQGSRQQQHGDTQGATRTAATTEAAATETNKYQNNNSFNGTGEGQINKFPSRQIKMNYVTGREAEQVL